MPAGSAWCQPALLLLLSCVPLWAAGISCRNEDGETVDWFALYKLPKHAKGQIPLLGLEYLYMDALTPQWQLGKHLINMSQGALGQTLQQLYETYESKRNTTAYAIYNDEIPESDSKGSKCGHTKGFLLLDKSQGFWVIHSVPLFPPSPEDGYGYPSTGESFGQTAICITFKYDQFTEIDQQMLSYNPGIYSCSIPDIFQADLPNLQKLCAKSRLPSPPLHHLSKLQSAQGETFLHFAKSHLFIDDAKHLGSACPSDSVLPLLPTATLLTGQTGSCQRGHMAWPLCSFREICSAKLTLQKCPNTGPWLGERRKLLPGVEPGVSSQHAAGDTNVSCIHSCSIESITGKKRQKL